MAGKQWLALALAALALTGCGAQAAPAEEAAETEIFTVDFLNTGKSDCALIRMDDVVILSDTADDDDLEAICALLDSYGVERIDWMVLSHYDKDHIGSAAELVRRYKVDAVIGPNYGESSAEYEALFAACRDTGTAWNRPMTDQRLDTDNGSVLLDPPDGNYGDDNNNSLLMTVTWKGKNLLFLGDAQKKRIEELESAALSAYELIKLPHHGDSSKKLEALVESTAPRWAVETVSPFEIVEKSLLESLDAAGTELFLTRDGAVRLRWDGDDLVIEQIQP